MPADPRAAATAYFRAWQAHDAGALRAVLADHGILVPRPTAGPLACLPGQRQAPAQHEQHVSRRCRTAG
jgi:hypothetical protein